jgi:hypothetical protein
LASLENIGCARKFSKSEKSNTKKIDKRQSLIKKPLSGLMAQETFIRNSEKSLSNSEQ